MFSFPKSLTWSELRSAMNELGITPSDANIVEFIVRFETHNDEKVIIVPPLGKYSGIGQFDAKTWHAVSDYPYDSSVQTLPAIDAILSLVNSNRRYHERKFPGIGYTKEIAYLYHNQGAPSAATFLSSGKLVHAGQSDDALRLFRDIKTKVIV